MSYGTTGGKRQREANRDRKKKAKEERLQRNRTVRPPGLDLDAMAMEPMTQLPEVKLEDIIVSGVAPRGPKGSNGPTKLFVGGLSWDTTSEMLQGAFSKVGPLSEATVVTDRYTGKSRGFGFVVFQSPIDAATAVKQLNGAELDGRTLRVNPADRG